MYPTLCGFVAWVLKLSVQKGINRLYFLARDGYLMHQIAIELTKLYNLDIDCRYLYCSRNAWRIPSYHIISYDEACSLIFSGGYKISPEILLNRVNFDEKEQKNIYSEIGYSIEDKDIILSKDKANEFANAVMNSTAFKKILNEKSITEYESTIGYLRQSGMFDGTDFALVDTGWTVSMQRTLKQLLHNEGYNKKVIGYYFGMYDQPTDTTGLEYYTYKKLFNNIRPLTINFHAIYNSVRPYTIIHFDAISITNCL